MELALAEAFHQSHQHPAGICLRQTRSTVSFLGCFSNFDASSSNSSSDWVRNLDRAVQARSCYVRLMPCMRKANTFSRGSSSVMTLVSLANIAAMSTWISFLSRSDLQRMTMAYHSSSIRSTWRCLIHAGQNCLSFGFFAVVARAEPSPKCS